mgnify:CR=1 FL=1
MTDPNTPDATPASQGAQPTPPAPPAQPAYGEYAQTPPAAPAYSQNSAPAYSAPAYNAAPAYNGATTNGSVPGKTLGIVAFIVSFFFGLLGLILAIEVIVAWTDRQGAAQQVALATLVAGEEPALAAASLLPR